MKQYLKYLKGCWKYAILAPVLMMIDTLGGVVQPVFLQKIIDNGIANNDINYMEITTVDL